MAAAGGKNDSISTSSEEELFDFFSILSSSIETKIRKDFNELIREPILSGKPEELRDTIPVEKLADQDSKFLEVYLENESDAEKGRMEEVKVHYKERLPPIGSFPRNTLLKPQSAIVFLHGANGSTFSFRRLLPLVAARLGVRSISIDRPPYGLTSRPMKTGGRVFQARAGEINGTVFGEVGGGECYFSRPLCGHERGNGDGVKNERVKGEGKSVERGGNDVHLASGFCSETAVFELLEY